MSSMVNLGIKYLRIANSILLLGIIIIALLSITFPVKFEEIGLSKLLEASPYIIITILTLTFELIYEFRGWKLIAIMDRARYGVTYLWIRNFLYVGLPILILSMFVKYVSNEVAFLLSIFYSVLGFITSITRMLGYYRLGKAYVVRSVSIGGILVFIGTLLIMTLLGFALVLIGTLLLINGLKVITQKFSPQQQAQ